MNLWVGILDKDYVVYEDDLQFSYSPYFNLWSLEDSHVKSFIDRGAIHEVCPNTNKNPPLDHWCEVILRAPLIPES
jgi:hypothetical protein